MKKTLTFLGIAALSFLLAYCTTTNKPASETAAQPDPLAADRAKHLAALRAKIAGKENLAAGAVFENIQRLKAVEAARLLEVMEIWSKVLGVSCDHCHVAYEWASEVKPEKEVTRQMVGLVNKLNDDLNNMPALKGSEPSISCYTCHRGETKPATKVKF